MLYEINIPFSGFYESFWSGVLDHEEEYFVEHEQQEGWTNENQPPELRLDTNEIAEITYMDAADYSAMESSLVASFFDAFTIELDTLFAFNFNPQIIYAGMDSPREYNFTTDRLFIKANGLTIHRFFTISRNEGHTTLESIIEERFTSRDGFSSFYSCRLADWLAKPLTEWDHNELGTLLRAAITIKSNDDILYFEQELENYVCESSYEYFEAGLDWTQYQETVLELRAEKAKEQGADYEPPYHCKHTVDLFAPAAT